jgi:uncharacterized protein YggE
MPSKERESAKFGFISTLYKSYFSYHELSRARGIRQRARFFSNNIAGVCSWKGPSANEGCGGSFGPSDSLSDKFIKSEVEIMRIIQGVALLWMALATGVMAQNAQNGITVSGEGVVALAPDMATIGLGVSARAATASDAMRQTSEKVTAILSQLDGLKVAGIDRQTSGLYLRPVYDNRPREDNSPVEVVGYEAGNTVSVTVRDLSKLGALLDAVVAEGANDFNGLQFGLQDNAEALIEARRGAVADAMARASQLAQAAGVTLGDVVQMSESSQGYQPMEMRASKMSSMDVPVETGEIEVRAQVTMQFAIAKSE